MRTPVTTYASQASLQLPYTMQGSGEAKGGRMDTAFPRVWDSQRPYRLHKLSTRLRSIDPPPTNITTVKAHYIDTRFTTTTNFPDIPVDENGCLIPATRAFLSRPEARPGEE
ncbi:hypothetical protein HO173_004482 [Letharia columbiana]|uniref:Uncharacterized protein n=1 Tax=Letharia columbiana TaxID=112416 RepID=A0A8H6FZE9_9LECA|nr:uncharacterized protein HO173_004482 [Letharia columbiana]KAF6237592.1 hypothetical protein HO173_004482 [Letharia columbiana]